MDTVELMKKLLEEYGEAVRKDAVKNDRLMWLLDKYGEACSYATAGRIIGRSHNTVKAMLEDGRLDYACAGTRVSVRSVARYLDAPRQENFKAYNRRRGRKYVVTAARRDGT